MKIELFILSILITIVGCSQDIVVEKVRFTSVDSHFDAEIPRVIDLKNANNAVVKKINSHILDRFMIESFEQTESENFRWNDVTYGSEIKDDILFIWFTGEHVGAYPVYVDDCFYFCLKTGEKLKLNVIPFQALFTLSGYLDFLNKYWLDGVKNAFIESAVECGEPGARPYCTYYDINYLVQSNKLLIGLMNDECYARVLRACAPSHTISVEINSVEAYLNDVGKYMLVESDYFSSSPIDKFIENKRLKEKTPDNLFLFGKIDDRFPFSMAIHVDKQNQISGYYYYDNRMQNINLHGEKNGENILLTEEVNGQITGFFELKITKNWDSKGFYMTNSNDEMEYLTGKWYNAEKTRQFDVIFTAAKTKGVYIIKCL
jgi:hypothetical protein